ncbi:MAG: hypothetical protein ACR2OB_15220 [Solirubrobacteraceae bacterium]
MTNPASSSRVLLVPDRRINDSDPESGSAPLRRYRLARLRFDGRAVDSECRFEHLKRVYD